MGKPIFVLRYGCPPFTELEKEIETDMWNRSVSLKLKDAGMLHPYMCN